jgi:hypothetical protein
MGVLLRAITVATRDLCFKAELLEIPSPTRKDVN